jgi:hypothetical protein
VSRVLIIIPHLLARNFTASNCFFYSEPAPSPPVSRLFGSSPGHSAMRASKIPAPRTQRLMAAACIDSVLLHMPLRAHSRAKESLSCHV